MTVCLLRTESSFCRSEELKGNDAICDVIAGGTLSDRKSMNFPNKVMKHAYLSKQDKDDLLFGIKNRGGIMLLHHLFLQSRM